MKDKSIVPLFCICLLFISVIGTFFSYFVPNDKTIQVIYADTYNISYVIDTPVYLTEKDSLNAFYKNEDMVYDVSILLDKYPSTHAYLTVIKPNNERITSLNNLENTPFGFDITNFEGRLNLAYDYPYNEFQTWKVIITLDEDNAFFKSPKLIFE